MPRPVRAAATAAKPASKSTVAPSNPTPNGTPRASRKRSAPAVTYNQKESPGYKQEDFIGEEEQALTPSRAKRSRTGPAPKYAQPDIEEDEEEEAGQKVKKSTVNKGSKGSPKKVAAGANGDIPPQSTNESAKAKAGPKAQERVTVTDEKNKNTSSSGGGGEEKKKKQPQHRKTKEQKDAEAMPLASRTSGVKMLLGAHVSSAGGVQNSVGNSVHIGGNAFALFLKSQRKWQNPPLKDEQRDGFISQCAHHKYAADAHVLPHGSYLVNLAQPDPDKAKLAYTTFLDDLQRCEALGIKLYNFHPGNTNGLPRAEAIGRLAKRLNDAHKATASVITVLENMAGAPEGNTLGSTFEDLHAVIDQIEDKSRVGVCIDTCHTFAAGYDLRSPGAFRDTLAAFDAIVDLKYLKALHINDSKAPLAAHRDLHQNIGLGFLGLRAFHNVVNEPRFHGLPLILETPIDHKDDNGKVVENKQVWADEIKLLESLVGMDPEGVEFKRLEADLASKGAAERKTYQAQFDKKSAKVVDEKKSATAGKGKSKTNAKGGSKSGGKKKKMKNKGSDESESSSSGGEEEEEDLD